MLNRMALLCAVIVVGCVVILAATAPDKGDAQGGAYGYSGQLTIRDVVRQTWPKYPLGTRTQATQIMYHEGGGRVSDGYCGWGIIESTQATYGQVEGLNAYQCSRYAKRLYKLYGWSPWETAGWRTPGAGQTPITYW